MTTEGGPTGASYPPRRSLWSLWARPHWQLPVLSLGTGLYLGRIIAENGASPLAWPKTVGLGLAGFALCLPLLHRLRHLRLTPLALCYVYAFYPYPDPNLALAVGLTVLLAMIIANTRGQSGVWTEVGIFMGGLALYLGTLATTVLPADAGEFQLVASLLGIAHPPGYPLYTMLARCFTILPVGDLAYRVNLFSAVTGALTLAAVGWAVRQLTPSPWPTLSTALALAGTTTFWAQATTANVRSLTALFTTLILALALSYGRKPNARHLTWLGAAFGLGVTHHGSVGFLALPVGAYLLSVDPALLKHPRRLLKPFAAAVLSLSVLLYLPLRDAAGAPLSPGDLTTFAGFTEHVLAEGFRGDMFALAQFALLPQRIAVFRDILAMQFRAPVLGAILGGSVLFLWRGNRRAFALIAGALLVNGFVGLTYRAPQTVEYLMPTYLCMALILGGGLAAIAPSVRGRSISSAVAILLAVSLYLGTAQLQARYPSFLQLHQDRSTRTYAEQVFRLAPQGATILANWHYFTPLRYLQSVAGQRPDITLRYIHPQGNTLLPELWLTQIERYVQGEDGPPGPVVVTNLFPEYEFSPYRFLPLGEAFLVMGPTASVGGSSSPGPDWAELIGLARGDGEHRGILGEPTGLSRTLNVSLGEQLELLAYRLAEQTTDPQRPMVLLLAWRAVSELDQDISLFAHLVGPDGVPAAQADVRHAAGRVGPGEIWADRLVLYLRPAVSPGEYTLIAGAYRPLADGSWERLATASGNDSVPLQEVDVAPSISPPVTLHPRHQPFAGGITLVGVDFDSSYADTWRVYLHWRLRGENPPVQIALFANGQPQGQLLLPANRRGGVYVSTACDIAGELRSLEIELRRSDDGTRLPPLGAWRQPQGGRASLPSPSPGQRYLSLGGKMVLARTRVATGRSLSARLTLVALQPLTHDYTLSLRLRGMEGQWEVQEDGTPASGAIPTLKWIRGTKVTDVRSLSPPPDSVLDGARLELLVYDAFTLEQLPPLDERLLAQGPSVPLMRIGQPDSAPQ